MALATAALPVLTFAGTWWVQATTTAAVAAPWHCTRDIAQELEFWELPPNPCATTLTPKGMDYLNRR